MVENNYKQLAAKWNGVNSLLVCPQPDVQGGVTTEALSLKELKWEVDLQSSGTRKLLNETHGIFMDLQETCEDENPDRDSLLATSLQYRAVLGSCIMKLQETMMNIRSKDMNESVKSELDLFSIMELIWHLCEVLLIESQSGGYCLKQLLSWIKIHFTDADKLGQAVMACEDPYTHPDYWSTIYGFVLQGRLDEVCDLLTHHPQRDHGTFDVFANIEELLRKMPLFQVKQGQSASDFSSKWQQWQSECLTRLQDGDFSQHPELEVVCELLCGNDSALIKTRDLCQSWYQILVAKLLYSEPLIKTSNLKHHAVEAMEMFNGIGKVTALDEIILSAVSLDPHKLIETCSDALPNWWFVAHLTDLLFHAGLLKSINLDYGADLREFLILEFSASLMSHPSLWTIAGDYLMSCPATGREHLEVYLEKLPLDCEKKALKVIHMCDKYGFTEQSYSICKVMGMKALHRKRLGVALSWCLRAKDEAFASYLTDEFLNHYMETGSFMQCDLIDNLGSSMLLNNKLTFLGKYHEFHKLYIDGKFKEAGSLLSSLLTSNLAPKKFWMVLLIDSLPLLEHKEIIFSSDQTHELLHCLQELQLSHDSTNQKVDMKHKHLEGSKKDQIELLYLALSKNLSRALLVQP